jgi:hypothetical protein
MLPSDLILYSGKIITLDRTSRLAQAARVGIEASMMSEGEFLFLADRRIAHLATADRCPVPHVVPVCFALAEGTLYITIDEKPKRHSGTALKR